MAIERGISTSPDTDASTNFLKTFEGNPEKFYSYLGAERHEGRLANGLRIVLFKKPGTKISLLASTVGGGRYDEGVLAGRAHFNEHMITSGTDMYPRPEELAQAIENVGGYFNAYTDEEEMAVDIRVNDISDFPLAMDIASACLTSSIYDPDTIETERKAILQEMSTDDSSLEDRLYTEYQAAFFPNTPLEIPVLGTQKTVSALTKNDLIAQSQEMFVAEKMVLIVSGNIPFDRLMDEANKSFGALSTGQRIEEAGILPEVIKDDGIVIHRFPGEERIAFCLGFRTTAMLHPDNAALGVLADIMGGGASLLMKKLRFDKGTGLVYDASAGILKFSDAGTFTVDCTTTKENMQKVFDITTNLLKDIRDNGLPADQIVIAKNRMTKELLGGIETTAAWASVHTSNEVLALRSSVDPNLHAFKYPLYAYVERLAQVTTEDVRRVAQKYFASDRLRLALCGDVTRKDFKINF